jgi:hypothetical protein
MGCYNMLSEEAQESQTKVDNDQESQQLGLILLKCSDAVLHKKSSVVLHEVENGEVLRNEVVMVENAVNGGESL